MQTALTPRQEFEAQLNEQVQNFRALLPSHIPVEKFKRVVVVAIAQTPALFKADRRSLFMAAQKCAADGLLPDGRQAALVIFGDQVQYLPMIAGIRQRMRNSGEVLSAEAHVVYRNDKFFHKLGDDPAIVHEPPAFGVDRGEPVGAYAIIKLKNGEVLREIMDKHQIEKVRGASRSKNGPAWTGWWDEMARKTVMRRCAKMAPTSADIDTLLSRDDDDLGEPMVDITPPEPEPPRAAEIAYTESAELPAKFLLVDCDGEEHEFNDVDDVSAALLQVLDDATRRGPGHVAAARENNAALIAEIGDPHSPAGTDGNGADHTQRKERAEGGRGSVARAPEVQPPAGERDLLGGKPAEPRSLYVPLQDETTDGWAGWRMAMWAMIEAKDPPAEILRDNRDNLAIFEQVDRAEHAKLMRKLDGGK